MGRKTCKNCERIIGNLEKFFVYKNHVVCNACKILLEEDSEVIEIVDSNTESKAMTIESQVKKHEPLKPSFFSYKGRINRAKYFSAMLLIFFICCLFGFLDGFMFSNSSPPEILLVVYIGLPIIASFPAVKRWHDVNKGGENYLWSLVPIANIVAGVILLFRRGTTGPNQYGPDPLDSSNTTLRGTKKKKSKLEINCPQCGRFLFGATQDMIGDTGVCPKCKAEFEIKQNKELLPIYGKQGNASLTLKDEAEQIEKKTSNRILSQILIILTGLSIVIFCILLVGILQQPRDREPSVNHSVGPTIPQSEFKATLPSSESSSKSTLRSITITIPKSESKENIAKDAMFVLVKLPLGVNIEVPKNWRLLDSNSNTTIETAGEAALNLAGINLPTGQKVNLFRANSNPPTTYAGIAINATDSDISPTELLATSEADIRELAPLMHQMFDQGLATQNLRVIQFDGIRREIVDGHPSLVIEYVRSGPKGPVVMQMTRLFIGDKEISLNLSYRQSETDTWKPIVEHMRSTFRVSRP